MKLPPAALAGKALVLLLLTGSPLRADLIRWTYSWSNTPNQIQANAPGTGSVHLTNAPSQSVVGDSSIVATNLTTSSKAPATAPDQFTNKTYSLNLTIQDTASGKSHTFTFNGQLNGSLTATTSNLANTFVGPTTLQWTLGNHLYTVAIGPYVPPGAPGTSNAGSISARALVTVQTLPEPSSLLMAALGGGLLGLRRWRRRQGRKSSERSAI
jgi:hypothetical protein